MSKDRKIILIAIIGALILFAANFEFVEVLPVTEKKKYNVEAPTALGTLVFHKMIKKAYGEKNVNVVNKLELTDTKNLDKTLVFRFGDRYEPLNNEITDLVNKGLNVVIAAHEIYMYIDSFSVNTRYRKFNDKDTLHLSFGDGSNKKSYEVVDTFIRYPKTNLHIYKYNEDDETEDLESKDTSDIEKTIWADSTDLAGKKDVETDTLAAQKLNTENPPLTPFYKSLITSDTNLIAFKMDMGKGKMLVHCYPRIFTNLGSLDSKIFASHLNFILSRFNGIEKVVILREHELIAGQKSKFSVLLRNKSLKAAYFISLSGVLLYLLFGLKRRMRPVEIIARKENTTLQYVDILSRMYQNQHKPYKLIKQMKKNFDEYVLHHYHLSSGQLQFIESLSKKSKVDYNLVQSIYSDFERLESERNIEEIKLITLHNKIEKFKRYAAR